MTNSTSEYRVIKKLWDGETWHDVGAKYPPERVGELNEAVQAKLAERVQKFLKSGHIDTPANIRRRENPEAAQAASDLEGTRAQLKVLQDQHQGLLTALAGDEGAPATADDALARIEQLKAAQAGAEGAPDLTALYTALDDTGSVDSVDGAVERARYMSGALGRQHQDLEALRAREKVLDQLHGKQDGDTDLPNNFKNRGPLGKYGLATWESLRGKTVAQLTAIPDLDAKEAQDIVDKVAAHFTPAAE